MTPCHCEQNHACQSLARRCDDCPVLQKITPEPLPQSDYYWVALLDSDTLAGVL
jgi:hypothetical protein